MRLLIPIIRTSSMIGTSFWAGLFTTAIFINEHGREVNLLGIAVPAYRAGGGDADTAINLFLVFFSLHSILFVLTTLTLLLPCLCLSRYDQLAMHKSSKHKWLEVVMLLSIAAGVLLSFLVANRTYVGGLLAGLFLALVVAGILYQLGAQDWFSRPTEESVPRKTIAQAGDVPSFYQPEKGNEGAMPPNQGPQPDRNRASHGPAG